ncbi:hypothetical protein [Gallaecimonas mangrovi]|uniref:hypothetical protein n=1 Tax=Gallaecimonas mangrovi TaxID=2291597 RepID=UPI0012601E41|nr:hypothetical protein [Gallaecimonas mangrovi]
MLRHRIFGLIGGPSFKVMDDYSYSLSGTNLTFRVPKTHIDLDKEMPSNIYINDKVFIKEYIDSFGPAIFIPVNKWRWSYSSNILYNNAAGSVSLFVRVRKLKDGKTIPDDESMRAYLTWEYDDYYENEESQGACGFNRSQRTMALDYYRRRYGERVDYSDALSEYLDNILMTVPQADDFKNFKGINNDWTYFFLKKEMKFPTSHYCLRLDEKNILDFFFTYIHDSAELKDEILKKRHKLEQRIMDTVTVDFHDALTVNDTSSGLLNP